ncbi:MAG: GNAT family N-acetyltransferase [Cruoricaptor ignavus]|nr:GNAT family N-acetyltransferase [Cruoricaptor ignavus]
MENLIFRKAKMEDSEEIWNILQSAIAKRKSEGSKQWQDGYPNPETIKNDIECGFGFVLHNSENIAIYCAIIANHEPAYENIQGKWLSNSDFLVIHRIAVSEKFLGKGLAKEIFRRIELYAKEQNINSIKVDTNYDNLPMLNILEKLGYAYCGEVFFRGSARKAFEKVL